MTCETLRSDTAPWFDRSVVARPGSEARAGGGPARIPEGWWQRAVAAHPDPVAVLGPGWEVLWVSDAAASASGVDPAVVLGRVLWDAVPGTSTSEEPLRRAARTGRTSTWEARIGGPRWYELQAVPVDGLVLVIARDADQRRAAAAEREALLERTRTLLEVSTALAAARTLEEVAASVVAVATEHLGADYGGLSVVDAAGRRVRTIARAQLRPDVEQAWADLPLDHPGPAPWVCRTGLELVLDDLSGVRARFPEVAERVERSGLRSGAVVPLVAEGTVVGSLTVGWTTERVVGPELDAVRAFAAYTAQAVRRAVLLADRTSAAEVLQRALLAPLPSHPGVELAVRYLPAASGDHVGGDWYDAVALDGHRLALVAGDAAGHDVAAAAVMGRVSGSVRSFVLAVDGPPSRTLEAVDAVMARPGAWAPTSAVVGVLGPPLPGGVRSWRWSNAGHPPPLLVTPDGRTTALARTPELLLGVEQTVERSDHLVTVPDGAVLLLHTDGLVERRDRDLDAGLDHLASVVGPLVVAHAGEPLEALLDAVLAACLPQRPEDDVVLLAVRPG